MEVPKVQESPRAETPPAEARRMIIRKTADDLERAAANLREMAR